MGKRSNDDAQSIGFGAGNNVTKPAKQRKRGRGKPFEKGNQWRWKPGQSGNPDGRPPEPVIVSEMRSFLEINPELRQRAMQHMARLMVGDVPFCEGNASVSAFKLVLGYVAGKPVQPISGPNGGPIPIVAATVDLSHLTDEQLAQLKLARRLATSADASGDRSGGAAPASGSAEAAN